MKGHSGIVLIFLVISIVISNGRKPNPDHRNGKLFSIFNIVTFPNDPCVTASDSTMMGTCMTSSDCSTGGGTTNGNCASGFGVCCTFTVSTCGTTINKNCTYIQNSGYPTGSTTLQTCQFTFSRISDDLCQIRLDFDNLVLTQPDSTSGSCTNGDTMVAVSPTGASPPSNICGTLTGQHMYLETGTTGTAGTFTITTSISTGTRSYKVKVSYIQCSNPSKAPTDCVQYFTGSSGTISSYNHQGGAQLQSQNFPLCIRQEEGYCSYDLRESAGSSPDAFDLLAATIDIVTAICTSNYIEFPNQVIHMSSTTAYTEMIDVRCGDLFGGIQADKKTGAVRSLEVTPFIINYFATGAANAGIGFNLDYTQVPC